MICSRCKGRVFLDRVFSDNRNYELSCIICGDRKFVNKDSKLGQWLTRKELARETAIVR